LRIVSTLQRDGLALLVVLKVVSCDLNLLTVSSRGHVGSAS
jgi:hypothetical protein